MNYTAPGDIVRMKYASHAIDSGWHFSGSKFMIISIHIVHGDMFCIFAISFGNVESQLSTFMMHKHIIKQAFDVTSR